MCRGTRLLLIYNVHVVSIYESHCSVGGILPAVCDTLRIFYVVTLISNGQFIARQCKIVQFFDY